jgi:hypothetical protein
LIISKQEATERCELDSSQHSGVGTSRFTGDLPVPHHPCKGSPSVVARRAYSQHCVESRARLPSWGCFRFAPWLRTSLVNQQYRKVLTKVTRFVRHRVIRLRWHIYGAIARRQNIGSAPTSRGGRLVATQFADTIASATDVPINGEAM